MANISKIKLPGSDTQYKLVDLDARKMIENLPSPMVFKGTLGSVESGATIQELPAASAENVGHTYKVITDGTYAGVAAKIGDVFTCAQITSIQFRWVHIPSGDEPSGTVTNVAVGTGLATADGNPITTSGTISLNDASIASLAKADTAIQTPASPVSGQFLKKTDSGWETAVVDALPSQSGQSGKYLTTDGSTASWGTLDLSTKADIAAPELTTKVESEVTYYPRAVTVGGALTPNVNDSSENIATTKWVQNLVNKLVGYDVDPESNTLSVSPLDTIANNELTLVSNAATIEQISGDEYSFNIVV